MRLFILFFNVGLLLASCARKISNVTVAHDKTVSLPMADYLVVGATMTYSNGKEKKTKSLLQGTKGWHGLVVNTKGGTFKNGVLFIDYAAAVQNGYKISISCKPKNNPEAICLYEIPIPKLQSIKIQPLDKPVTPGIATPLKFEMGFDNGKNLQANSGSSFRFLKDLNLSYQGIEHTATHPVFVPRRLAKYDDSIEIRCYYKMDPSRSGSDYLPVTYKASHELNITGTTGIKGAYGQDGHSDVNGYDGQHAGSGYDGGSIPTMQVWISVLDTAAHLAAVVTSMESHVEYYTFDYSSPARLSINANGGKGGDGGDGGRGGDGRDETDKASAGSGGDGGNGANGGNGGNGADVNIFVEDGFQQLATQLLHINHTGGKGGAKGEGGKGGRNGNKLKPSTGHLVLKLLGTQRGSNGTDGSNGSSGRNGYTKITPLPQETILLGIGQLHD